MITPDAQAAIAAQLRACGVSDACLHCGGTEHNYMHETFFAHSTPRPYAIERVCQNCGAIASFARDFGLDVTVIARGTSKKLEHQTVYHLAGIAPPLPDDWRIARVIRRNPPTPAEPVQSED